LKKQLAVSSEKQYFYLKIFLTFAALLAFYVLAKPDFLKTYFPHGSISSRLFGAPARV
jgi:hypothetical protein